jgi:hypothetical protein
LTDSITGDRDDIGYSLLKEALRESSSASDSSKQTSSSSSSESNTHIYDPENPKLKMGISVEELSTKDLLLRCQQAIAEAELRYKGVTIGSVSQPVGLGLGLEQARSSSGQSSSSHGLDGGEGGNSGKSDLFFGSTPAPSVQKSKIGRGLVILIQVVTANFRHLSLLRTRIASVILLVRLGLGCCDDDVVLKRVLPTLVLALVDPSPTVRALSVRYDYRVGTRVRVRFRIRVRIRVRTPPFRALSMLLSTVQNITPNPNPNPNPFLELSARSSPQYKTSHPLRLGSAGLGLGLVFGGIWDIISYYTIPYC